MGIHNYTEIYNFHIITAWRTEGRIRYTEAKILYITAIKLELIWPRFLSVNTLILTLRVTSKKITKKKKKEMTRVKMYRKCVFNTKENGREEQKKDMTYKKHSKMRDINPQFSQFSHSVVSDSLQLHRLQHARTPCPSPTPRVYSNSCPLSCWCHPTISSSVVPVSSCLQSFPASGSFQMSQLFPLGGESIGVSMPQHQSFQWIFRTDFL